MEVSNFFDVFVDCTMYVQNVHCILYNVVHDKSINIVLLFGR